MATYSELEGRVKRRLGRAGMNISAEFLDEMKAAQEKLEKGPIMPKFIKTISDYETTAAGAITLTALPPEDYLRVFGDDGITYLDEDGREKRAYRVDTHEQLRQLRNDPSVAGWRIYYYENSREEIEIAPTQTRNVEFRMRYYIRAETLTGANENLWTANAGELIMAEAGKALAMWLRDDRAFQYYEKLSADELNRIRIQNVADEMSDLDLVMGGRD